MNRLLKAESEAANTLNSSESVVFGKKREVSSLTDMPKSKLNTNDQESPLNSWFRQQGGSFLSSSSSSSKTSKSMGLRLPRLSNPSTNSGKASQDKKENIKAKKFNNSTNLKNSSTNSAYFNSSSTYSNFDDKEEASRDTRTPQPTNLYYQQCIDEVFKSNLPEKLKLIAPRELKYVRSIPFFKYVTFGSGKSFGCIWQIEIFKD